jgi:hypothetical protein
LPPLEALTVFLHEQVEYGRLQIVIDGLKP